MASLASDELPGPHSWNATIDSVTGIERILDERLRNEWKDMSRPPTLPGISLWKPGDPLAGLLGAVEPFVWLDFVVKVSIPETPGSRQQRKEAQKRLKSSGGKSKSGSSSGEQSQESGAARWLRGAQGAGLGRGGASLTGAMRESPLGKEVAEERAKEHEGLSAPIPAIGDYLDAIKILGRYFYLVFGGAKLAGTRERALKLTRGAMAELVARMAQEYQGSSDIPPVPSLDSWVKAHKEREQAGRVTKGAHIADIPISARNTQMLEIDLAATTARRATLKAFDEMGQYKAMPLLRAVKHHGPDLHRMRDFVYRQLPE